MKFVKLLGHAYVNGAMRGPEEGVLHLTDEEAERLLKQEIAVDVSADFEGLDDAVDVPVERITVAHGDSPDLAPVPAEAPKPARGKRTGTQE